MSLRLVGKNLFEQLYPIKHFTYPQVQDKDSGHDSGHSEEKYSQHLPVFWTVSATATHSPAPSRLIFVCLVVIIVCILLPQIHDDVIFIARDKTQKGAKSKRDSVGRDWA
jgi:hypothetical protein